jgi:hypothetical protein
MTGAKINEYVYLFLLHVLIYLIIYNYSIYLICNNVYIYIYIYIYYTCLFFNKTLSYPTSLFFRALIRGLL